MYEYNDFKYLYPPRPEWVLTYDRIPYWEAQGWIGQYKKNGTNTIVGLAPVGHPVPINIPGVIRAHNRIFYAMNRHQEAHRAWQLTAHVSGVLAELLPRDSITVLVGEIMHSKTPTIKDTIYFHDVIVYGSKQLVGSTYAERQKILERLLPAQDEDYSHYIVDDKVWRAKSLKSGILQAYHDIEDIKIDEGIVLKNPKGKLKPCRTEKSNQDWQAKVRYATKNYQF